MCYKSPPVDLRCQDISSDKCPLRPLIACVVHAAPESWNVKMPELNDMFATVILLLLKVRGINNGDVELTESLSVMLGIIYYLQACKRGRSRTQWYGKRVAVSQLGSTYSFSDLQNLCQGERRKRMSQITFTTR